MFKNYFEGKKAAFFDLDGTIVKETLDLKAKALQKVLKEIKSSYIDAQEYRFDGHPFKTSWEVILKIHLLEGKGSVSELTEKTKAVCIDLIKSADINVVEGFWDFVYELKNDKGFKLALTTNSEKEYADIVTKKLGVDDVFDLVIYGDDVKRLKPYPEMYKKAARILKLKPKEVLVFEDSAAGVESAGEAGMDTIVIWDGKSRKSGYKGRVLDFVFDFSVFPGNMDETHEEQVIRKVEEAAGVELIKE